MKFFKNKKTTTMVATVVATLATSFAVFAAEPVPVKQDAYYDTFQFIVDSKPQVITDIQFKPFIANSRVYVPIKTLNDLGIANVTWTPSASQGILPVLSVMPNKAVITDPAEVQNLKQREQQLTTALEAKKTEADKLVKENNELKDEIASLKKELNKEEEKKETIGNKDIKKIEDSLWDRLDRYTYYDNYEVTTRNNGEERKDVRKLDVKFKPTVSTYRDEIDIRLEARDLTSSEWSDYKHDHQSANISDKMEDFLTRQVVREVETILEDKIDDKDDLDINIELYLSDNRSRIATATYERGRLDVDLK